MGSLKNDSGVLPVPITVTADIETGAVSICVVLEVEGRGMKVERNLPPRSGVYVVK